jgi:Domain of unknown function (DUF5658)
MVRIAPPRSAAALLLSVALAASASAQDRVTAGDDSSEPAAKPPATQIERAAVAPFQPAERRPPALIPLYASFVTLEMLDVHSTSRALANGGVEANPAIRGVAGNAAAMIAMKAAGSASLIFASEKIWKKNRTAAVVLMIATNSAMAWVVAHNYQVAR